MIKDNKPIIPTLEDFESTLFEISQVAAEGVNRIYENEKLKGKVMPDGNLRAESSSVGSSIMYLDMRSKLYKFFESIPYIPTKFYFIFIFDRSVSITLRNINSGHTYILNYAGYNIVVDLLREKYNWEIYNDVRID